MLTIIHGSDVALSRKFFLDEKQKHHDAILLDADKVNITDLTQIFEGGGLFGETKSLFIEQLLTKKKKSSDFEAIFTYLKNKADENIIILWEGKELERSTLNALKNAVVRPFNLPQTLFQLLDAIKPNNAKTLISLFQQTVSSTEAEMIFFMLIRQFRILLALSSSSHSGISASWRRLQNPDSGQVLRQAQDKKDSEQSRTARMTDPIDELKRMQPWQKNKLEKQAALFDMDHLLSLYHKLFQIEVGQKTGTLTLSLISAIDFFLLEV